MLEGVSNRVLEEAGGVLVGDVVAEKKRIIYGGAASSFKTKTLSLLKGGTITFSRNLHFFF